MKRVIDEVIELLHEELEKLVIEDIRVGLHYTASKLSNNYVGLAYTPIKETNFANYCCNADEELLRAGNLAGSKAIKLTKLHKNLILSSITCSVLNAASYSMLFKSNNYNIILGKDALESAKLSKDDEVVMVGAFKSFIKFLRSKVKLRVYDKNKELLRMLNLAEEQDVSLNEALRSCDVAIITGSSIVNHTIDEILKNVKGAKEVMVVGATASMIPEPFFNRGATMLAGVKVNNPNLALKVVSEGGGARNLKTCCTKFVIRK
jgi:hypothetical protein